QVTTQLNSALSTVLTPVGLTAQVPPVNTPIDTALNSVKALLAGDLAGALAFLNDASLLKLDGAEIAVTSKAADTLANSRAGITALTANLDLSKLTAPLAQIVAAANPATGTIAAQLQSLGGTVPALDPAMATLNTALSDPGGALAAAGTANVVVGQVLSASDFAPTVVA